MNKKISERIKYLVKQIDYLKSLKLKDQKHSNKINQEILELRIRVLELENILEI